MTNATQRRIDERIKNVTSYASFDPRDVLEPVYELDPCVRELVTHRDVELDETRHFERVILRHNRGSPLIEQVLVLHVNTPVLPGEIFPYVLPPEEYLATNVTFVESGCPRYLAVTNLKSRTHSTLAVVVGRTRRQLTPTSRTLVLLLGVGIARRVRPDEKEGEMTDDLDDDEDDDDDDNDETAWTDGDIIAMRLRLNVPAPSVYRCLRESARMLSCSSLPAHVFKHVLESDSSSSRAPPSTDSLNSYSASRRLVELDDEDRSRLLFSEACETARRLELVSLRARNAADSMLVCRSCGCCLVASVRRAVQEGAESHYYINPVGDIHMLIPLPMEEGVEERITNVVIDRAPPDPSFSWFPSYGWQGAYCMRCGHHLGWKFTCFLGNFTRNIIFTSRFVRRPSPRAPFLALTRSSLRRLDRPLDLSREEAVGNAQDDDEGTKGGGQTSAEREARVTTMTTQQGGESHRDEDDDDDLRCAHQ